MKHTAIAALAVALTLSTASGQQITLKVLGFKAGGELGPIPALNAQFMRENPNIRVDYQGISDAAGYNDIIRTRLAGGDAPDVFMGHSNRDLRLWSQAGYLADLSNETWVKQMTASTRSLSQINGKTQQFMFETIGLGVLVNMDLLAQVGIRKAPETYAEFLAALNKLKTAGKTPMLVGAKNHGFGPTVIAVGLAANTIARSNQKYVEDLTSGKSKFDSAAWRTVMSNLTSLGTNGYYNSKISPGVDGLDEAMNEFAAGRVAFVPHGSWVVGQIKKLNPDLNFVFAPFPGGAARTQPYGVEVGGGAWAVSAKSKHAEAARKYVAFWAQERNLNQWLASANAFSSLKNSKSTLPKEMTPFANAVAGDRTVPFLFQNVSDPAFEGHFATEMQRLVLGKSPRDVVRALDQGLKK